MDEKPGVSIVLRDYAESDHARVLWLFQRTPPWGRTYPAPQPPPDDIEVMASYFDFKMVATDMDIAGEAVVGFAAAGPTPAPGEEHPPIDFHPTRPAQLYWLSVAPERWRLGIGRDLVDRAASWAKERGYHELLVETTTEQRGAIALYLAAGFSEVGRYLLGGRWNQVCLARRL